MGELLRGKVTAYPQEDARKGLVEVSVGAFDTELATVLARVEPPAGGVYWLPELETAVEVEVPDGPGGEARVLHVRRQESDAQVSACWTEQNDLKQIRTRSGHTLTFDDTQDAASITLRSAGGLELRLDDKAKTVTVKGEGDTPVLTLEMDSEKDAATLSAGKTLKLLCGGATVEIDSQGNISVSTGGNLDVSAKDITLTASGSFTAKGQDAKLSGGASAAVSGQTKLDLTSSGVTKLTGSMVKLN